MAKVSCTYVYFATTLQIFVSQYQTLAVTKLNLKKPLKNLNFFYKYQQIWFKKLRKLNFSDKK